MESKQQPHHFFGSTAMFWEVGTTRQEVIEKLAKRLSNNTNLLMAPAVKQTGGVYCWTCRVDLPLDAHYEIRNYAPWNVPVVGALSVNITSKKGDIRLIEDTEEGLRAD